MYSHDNERQHMYSHDNEFTKMKNRLKRLESAIVGRHRGPKQKQPCTCAGAVVSVVPIFLAGCKFSSCLPGKRRVYR
ncbi:hypothetical protein Y032_0062g3374 [Ancylostoma ceylanicum]|nr:hypothetical protein Y032_0062g3374 [Ancylostoma ceylanicum]